MKTRLTERLNVKKATRFTVAPGHREAHQHRRQQDYGHGHDKLPAHSHVKAQHRRAALPGGFAR